MGAAFSSVFFTVLPKILALIAFVLAVRFVMFVASRMWPK